MAVHPTETLQNFIIWPRLAQYYAVIIECSRHVRRVSAEAFLNDGKMMIRFGGLLPHFITNVTQCVM